LPLAVAVLVAGATVFAWQRLVTTLRRAAPAVVRFDIEPLAGVTSVSNLAIADDGRFIVYEGRVDGQSRLFLRWLDGAGSRIIAGTEGARRPFGSPDGAWIQPSCSIAAISPSFVVDS
jgi:hypothetical protein